MSKGQGQGMTMSDEDLRPPAPGQAERPLGLWSVDCALRPGNVGPQAAGPLRLPWQLPFVSSLPVTDQLYLQLHGGLVSPGAR